MQYTNKYTSPLGELTLASDGEAITGIWFEGQKYYADTLSDDCEEKRLEVFEQTKEWFDLYFTGTAPDFTPPLSLSASSFRMQVWEILKGIPFGETVTYGNIARRIEAQTGKRVSAQAVGGAVGHNPISVIVPCHRVIGSGGNLTGYAGGIYKKIELLKIEGVDLSKLTVPKNSGISLNNMGVIFFRIIVNKNIADSF